MRSELEHATREFADFRRVSNQMINEGFDEIVKQADTIGVQLKDALEKMANEAIKPVEAASSKLSSAIDASVGQIASKLSEIGTSAALDDLASRTVSSVSAALLHRGCAKSCLLGLLRTRQ